MRDRNTFWTGKRLSELRSASKRLNDEQLSRHFDRPVEDIIQAKRFEANNRRLFIEKRSEIINGKTVKIRVYAAEYAEGAKQSASQWQSLGSLW